MPDWRTALAAVEPTAVPVSMPPAFYRAEDVLDAETEQVFLPGWICVGRGDEIPETGDFYTLDVIGEPLIVTRAKDGIRVLSNVCRHRGSRLAEGHGRTKRFSCPYHAWTYALDGGLIRAPLVENQPGFDRDACALPGFPVAHWMGWIFVNLDRAAAPLLPQLTDLDPLVRNYHAEEMRVIDVAVEEWAVNWKGLAENFMEGYHLTPVHLRTLHPMTPTRLCEKSV
ncbi:MAG: aromatic ring-hydroxylating dioxygenase subunit alpha, partial [Pseudomonadota bacterium]